ncbi:hypothetical protein K469DRAFT_26651 [Zopfia rhizophila CBS 207.26]|uniref:Uncharacterized protein n=1 Tax=Zopfia rhizophila CBS 207.26 TaxID=1314779 RepID=A0A6A6EI18_9PEZI|nr:hypothetical protein K469DRAFT_26651 [Zopfia rhizophila CBS 207.26]
MLRHILVNNFSVRLFLCHGPKLTMLARYNLQHAKGNLGPNAIYYNGDLLIKATRIRILGRFNTCCVHYSAVRTGYAYELWARSCTRPFFILFFGKKEYPHSFSSRLGFAAAVTYYLDTVATHASSLFLVFASGTVTPRSFRPTPDNTPLAQKSSNPTE